MYGTALVRWAVPTVRSIVLQVTMDFEPFKPINTSLYLCDNKFHTEALNELLESDNRCVQAYSLGG